MKAVLTLAVVAAAVAVLTSALQRDVNHILAIKNAFIGTSGR